MLEELVAANLADHGPKAMELRVREALERLDRPRRLRGRRNLCVAALRAFAVADLPRGIAFGESLVSQIQDPRALRALVTYHQRCGAIKRPHELLAQLDRDKGQSAQLTELARQARLLRNGISYEEPTIREWTPVPRRILYHVNQSLPHHGSGYAIRTHGLVSNLRERGWEVAVHARVGYPNDRYDFIGARTVPAAEEIDGVPYTFVPDRKRGIGVLDIEIYQAASVALLVEQMAEFRPALVHCASNYSCGLAGTAAAKRLGIPSIYEVRGLWHITRAARQPEYADSDHYRMIERLEAQAAHNADHVFAITVAVRDILVGHGVPEEKITILPNAVNPARFKPAKRNRGLADELKLSDRVVIGYIGSFTGYEGLDDLLEAVALLRTRLGEAFAVLLVGDGTAYDELVELSRQLEVQEVVKFTGRVPHDLAGDYYSLIDIAVYPRKGVPVCEIVSPLKPLEAMAMGKAVVASEVRALAEMVVHEQTGLLHARDDVTSLAEQLERLVLDAPLRERLGEAARRWVGANCTWSDTSEKVQNIYHQLINPEGME